MELRKNESIFEVMPWHLAKWGAPSFIRQSGGHATVDEISALADVKYPGLGVSKYFAKALSTLQKAGVVVCGPDGRWSLTGEETFEGVCVTCKEPITRGQLCHRRTVWRLGTSHRHVLCARQVGVLKMTNADYRIWRSGLKQEKELLEKMMNQPPAQMEEAAVPLGRGQVGIVNANITTT